MPWSTVFGPDAFNGTAFTALPTYNSAYTQISLGSGGGDWRISSNSIAAGCTVASTARCSLVSAPAADQSAEYTILGPSLASLLREEGLLLRFTDGDAGNFWGGTGYVAFIETDQSLYIYRLDGGGSHTLLGSVAITPANLDVWRFEIIGSAWAVQQNGAVRFNATDATYATGTVGLWAGLSLDDSTNMSVDGFTVQTFAAASAGYLLVKN